MRSRSFCEISNRAIRHNIREIQKMIPTNTKILGIVKANAYGAGFKQVASILNEMGSTILAVATIEEAIQLRNADIHCDILILGHTSFKEMHLLETYHLIQSVFSLEHAKHLAKYNVRTHLKIDTGMGRMGFVYRPFQKNLDEILETLKILKNVEGIFSHFAVADSNSEENLQFTESQIQMFEELRQQIQAHGYHIPYAHLQNSYGIINYPELTYDFVRPGILLLGAVSHMDFYEKQRLNLQPALTWKCKVGLVKEVAANSSISYGRTFIAPQKMKVATITVGYADGYPRCLSNKGSVLINGKRCPILGRVCMDQIVVDVTGISVKVDDEVVLIGKSGNEEIKVEELALLADTITNDIFCMISERVERIYYD